MKKLPHRFAPFLFAAIQAGITTAIATGLATYVASPGISGFMRSWLVAWAEAWLIILPVVIVAAPFIRNLVLRLVDPH